MSNEELVKMARLAQRDDRMATGALYGDLADRIEELEREKDVSNELGKALEEDAGQLREKLAKAVEIGNKMAASIKGNYYILSVAVEWEDMLAELEGGE